MSSWVHICDVDDVEEEDLIVVEHEGRKIAVYRSPDDEFFATSGMCTHEDVSLADGLVTDYVIECPMHNARFDYRTGEVKSAPACVALQTFTVKRHGEQIMLDVSNL